MAWSTPVTVVTGDVITAAWGNTYVRDNTAYLKDVLAGTNADKIDGAAMAHPVTRNSGGNQTDGLEWVLSGGYRAHIQPILTNGIILSYNGYYDGTNWQRDGTGNPLTRLQVDNSGLFFGTAAAGANPATISEVWFTDLNGKMRGLGFYDSGEFSLAASASTTLTHGLGAKPRFVLGYQSNTTGEVAGATATAQLVAGSAPMSVLTVSSTGVVVQNTAGATRYGRILAML